MDSKEVLKYLVNGHSVFGIDSGTEYKINDKTNRLEFKRNGKSDWEVSSMTINNFLILYWYVKDCDCCKNKLIGYISEPCRSCERGSNFVKETDV